MKTQALPAWLGDEPKSPALRSLLSFWFEPADPTLLGVIRICTGCVMVYVYLTYSIGLMGFVGPDAWVDQHMAYYLTHEFPVYTPPSSFDGPDAPTSPEEMDKGFYLASVYFHVTDPVWIWIIHLSILTVMVLFTVGYQTSITSVLSWLGALCYMHRSQPTLFGMDTMTNILLLYLSIGYFFISAGGTALSLDRWLAVRRLRRLGLKHIDPPAPAWSARLALRLIQIHFCFIYLASGTAKLQGSTWWSCTALWGCFANLTFAPMTNTWYVALLRLLSRNRLVWEMVMSGGVAYTLLMEIGFPFCVWTRLRWVCIIGSILLHLGIGLVMGLGSFSMMMFTMVLAFTPPELTRAWLASFRRRRESEKTRLAMPATVAKPAVMAATS